MYKTLPLPIKYNDKIELVRNLLKIYAVFKKMTKRNMDLLTVCLLEDVNANDFRKIVISSKLGFDNDQHVNSELHRLRKAGFLIKDDYNRDNLEENLKRIQELVNSETKIGLYITYDKK